MQILKQQLKRDFPVMLLTGGTFYNFWFFSDRGTYQY